MTSVGSARLAGYTDAIRSPDASSTPLQLPANSYSVSTGACTGPQGACANGVALVLEGGPVWLGAIVGPPATSVALLAAYLDRGGEFLSSLQGRFALAIIDSREHRVTLAVDPMGMERVAYAVHRDGIVFASTVETVRRSPAIAAGLRPQAVFDFLLLHVVPAPNTIYEGVYKLRPGTSVTFENGRVSTRRFWNPTLVECGGERPETLALQLRDALRESVKSCVPTASTGAFLSGGLDSSTLVGVYAAMSRQPVHAFSMGFGVDEFNEIEYARLACRHFGAIGHEYQVMPEDVVVAFPLVAAAYDEPFGNSSAVPTYICAKFAAQHGFNRLLAGDGGDELFAGNGRYAKQGAFERYRRLPQGLRSAFIEPIATLINPASSIPLLRKARSFIDQASISLPERFEYWNFIYRSDAGTMLTADFRAAIDPRAPFAAMADVYGDSPGDSTLARMLYYDWQYTLSDNDLRKVSTMCALAGVAVDYPMLHPAVLNLSLKVPPAVKMPRNQLRHFYKQALTGFLPDEIIHKKKHGFGLPFGEWLKVHAPFSELVGGLLNDLKRRELVRGAFIDDLVQQQRAGHASYYGYAIWNLAMLEAWFQAHDF
jgi:asparagine synthase (glutamine-hydrolysing)